ncbi:hypothetical protein RJ639_000893 [Escallonia herrerae]|uniref:Phosphoglycerate kinase n=1 Tax=Escallonia herrerae TaxID=1293975 RepID=A0AA88XAI9_9ASTE|nr:hypothetical protein RJ639_000893 [Escallonia herrerae]
MASAASPTSLSLIPTTSSSTSRTRLAPTALPIRFLRSPLRRLGFAGAAADPFLSAHVASKLRSLKSSGKPVRGVASMAKKSVGDLTEADLKGKKVFVRADLNVPLDDAQKITDDTRIRAAVPTIKYLISKGAKVILSSHLGRPKGVTPKFSLAPLVPRLTELLGIEVVKADDCIGPDVEKLVASLPEGGVLLLENVRFYKEEEKNEPEFAKKLASLADLYVNDAFGTAHRAHASTEGVTKFLKPSVAGFLLQKELDYLVGAVSSPKRPFAAIVGGSKVSSKIGVIESLLEKCDILLLGGGMIFTFYKAQGLPVGSSLVEEDKLELATTLLAKAKAKGVSLLLPTDVIVADKFAPDADSKVVPASAIPDGWMGLDIGPDSVKTFNEALETTKTVIWNGPMGVFEFEKFAVGTESVAKKLAELSGKGVTTIIGGGDSVAAVEKVGVADVMSHISTGGGASLELLEGKELPGVIALDEVLVAKSVGTLKEADLKGKKVFVRVDLNVPLDDNFNITDDNRIRAAVPTIKYLMGHGAKVILSSHLGRPKGVTPKYSLKPLVPRLCELLGVEVKMANDCIGEEVEKLVAEIPEGGVLLLENVRFYKEEEKNDPEFAKKLASLADLYVNDAFGTAHRAHASTEGVAKYLRPSVAGFLMQKELDYLVGAVSNPKKPFAAIVGGSKVSSKIGVIESLLEKVNILVMGGGMIFTFYKAQGYSVGSSLVEEDKLDLATSLLEKAKSKGVSLMLPSDVVIADKFSPDANSKIVPASSIPDGWMGLDIGPDSIKAFGEALDTTQTIIWNGPMGVFEFEKFAAGTDAIAKKLADLSGKGVTTIIGGGDSVAAVEKVGLADKMSHISTGGGASLELLEGKTLPGVLALDDA